MCSEAGGWRRPPELGCPVTRTTATAVLFNTVILAVAVVQVVKLKDSRDKPVTTTKGAVLLNSALVLAAFAQVAKLKHSRDKLLEEIDSQWQVRPSTGKQPESDPPHNMG